LGDESLQMIINLVLEGLPENNQETPSCALPYFDFRDTLSYVDGIILKGEAVVIPATLRSFDENQTCYAGKTWGGGDSGDHVGSACIVRGCYVGTI
jgi:hypothetical protein